MKMNVFGCFLSNLDVQLICIKNCMRYQISVGEQIC